MCSLNKPHERRQDKTSGISVGEAMWMPEAKKPFGKDAKQIQGRQLKAES
jgi:hypothetical protein